jgi:hypothetical protein
MSDEVQHEGSHLARSTRPADRLQTSRPTRTGIPPELGHELLPGAVGPPAQGSRPLRRGAHPIRTSRPPRSQECWAHDSGALANLDI